MSGSMYVVFNKNFNIQSIGRSNREIGYKELKTNQCFSYNKYE